MIVSTPLDIPKLEPDDWDKWWYIWNNYAAPLVKVGTTPNRQTSAPHLGFDVYCLEGYSTVYTANCINLESIYPTFYNQIKSIPLNVQCVRFVLATGNFKPHSDHFYPNWSVRSMFFCKDPEPQWYYTDMNDENMQYLKLPETTNWWAYYDGMIKHGTNYREEYPKIIVQMFTDKDSTKDFVEKQFDIFPDYKIEYDIG